jgi:PIN domain nuclease of toxin-antitoxin system
MGSVRVLLDTHTLLWWLDDDRRLSRRARAVIASAESTVHVSSASAWEVAIKVSLGKLRDSNDALARFPSLLVERGLSELSVSVAHAVAAGALPGIHRDPFDRMLVAQSRVEDMPIVTNDRVFRRYGAKVIW